MYLPISKIVFASSIFALTLVTGIIPSKIAKHNARLLGLCNAFASGVFLSAALIHLLPDATSKFADTYSYPFAPLICLMTFVLLLVLERGVFIYGKNHLPNGKAMSPIFLIVLLSVHSIIEGAAIGINSSFIEASAIFFAVLAHKGSESFALSANLYRFNISAKNIRRIITIFSLMTPLGIFMASSISTSMPSSGNLLEAIFCAVAAGTFLYLGAEYLVEEQKSFAKPGETVPIMLGITLMALVAIWI